MNREQIQTLVADTVATVLQCAPADVAQVSRADLPGWDSLKHVQILFALEDALGLEFDEAEMAGLDSVPRIVEAVVQRHAA